MRLPDANSNAIGLLKALLAACVVVPLALFALASWLNYKAAFNEAAIALDRLVEVAQQHADKVFDGQGQVVDRINDLVRGMDIAAIRRSELPLHEAFGRIVQKLPQVQSVLLASRDGRPLVSAGTYPVPRDVDLRGRDYFRAIVDGFLGTFVSALQFGDVNRQLFFGLARPWSGEGGSLLGVIDVAVSPAFFSEFYRALLGDAGTAGQGRVLTLIRDDGQILVRFPPFDGPPPRVSRSTPFSVAIREHPDRGRYVSRSVIDSGAPERIFSYRKVEGYPVYVVAGRSRSTILAEWRTTMASHLVFGVPATLALIAVTATALARTRREADALARVRLENARREAAEAALLRAQRLEAVGQMTGGIAHDFNNLLTVILGSAELLSRRAGDAGRVRQIADQILLAARRGGEVTQQLLAFSRRQLLQPETINLNTRLRDFRQLLERAAHEAIEVKLDLAPDLAPVRLDPGHFEAAILNLIGNARDAMPQGGGIVIATRNVRLDDHAELPPGDYVRVTVADTGDGMDAATVAKAFEPFFTTKEIGKGTGLGLSQVYGFVKQAGGDVRIFSARGSGTTIELLLPRSPTASDAAASDPAEADPAASTIAPMKSADDGEVVLVVEDEPDLLAMTVESLRDIGYATLTASSAQAALDMLKTAGRVDALFSDVVMPGGINGVQLAAEAQRLRPDLKVLLTSGYATELATDRSHDLPLLAKPYDRRQLAARLGALLRA